MKSSNTSYTHIYVHSYYVIDCCFCVGRIDDSLIFAESKQTKLHICSEYQRSRDIKAREQRAIHRDTSKTRALEIIVEHNGSGISSYKVRTNTYDEMNADDEIIIIIINI